MSDSYAGAAVTPARIEERGEPEPNWHPILRIAFRFVFAYLVLYMLVGAPLGVILSIETQFGTAPGGKVLQKGIEKVWTPVVTWVGHHVYHFPLQDSGSSTEFDSQRAAAVGVDRLGLGCLGAASRTRYKTLSRSPRCSAIRAGIRPGALRDG